MYNHVSNTPKYSKRILYTLQQINVFLMEQNNKAKLMLRRHRYLKVAKLDKEIQMWTRNELKNSQKHSLTTAKLSSRSNVFVFKRGHRTSRRLKFPRCSLGHPYIRTPVGKATYLLTVQSSAYISKCHDIFMYSR